MTDERILRDRVTKNPVLPPCVQLQSTPLPYRALRKADNFPRSPKLREAIGVAGYDEGWGKECHETGSALMPYSPIVITYF